MYTTAELHMIRGERDLAPPIIERIENIAAKGKNTEDKMIQLLLNFIKALYLKYSNRSRDKSEAEKILIEIINSEMINHRITIHAITHLAELLVTELKTYGEREVFDEIMVLVNKLVEMSESEMAIDPLVRALLLKSKLKIVEKDLEEADKILNRAYNLTIEYNLGELNKIVSKEKTDLEDSFQDMQKLIASNPSFADMINRLNIANYIKQAQGMKNIETEL